MKSDFRSYFTHLECSSGCGAGPFNPRDTHFLCPSCKLPMLARYDLDAARAWRKESLADRAPNMWRYRELMPLLAGDEPVTLGEGFTPLIHARRLGATLGLERLMIKDESLNPTNSFKARGLAAAVTKAAILGATTLSVPSAGNAANAMAAYAAAALPALPAVGRKMVSTPSVLARETAAERPRALKVFVGLSDSSFTYSLSRPSFAPNRVA